MRISASVCRMCLTKQKCSPPPLIGASTHRQMYTMSKMYLTTGGGGQLLLEKALQSIENAFRSRDIVTFTSSLKSFASSSNAPSLRDHVGKYLTTHSIDAMDDKTIGDNIWSVGKIGLSFNRPQHKEICLELLKKFASMKELDGTQMTKCLTGFYACGLKWAFMPESLQLDIYKQLVVIVPTMDSMQLTVLLNSLAQMNACWGDMPTELIVIFSIKINDYRDNFKNRDISQVLHALGSLDYKVPDFIQTPSEVELNLLLAIAQMAVKIFHSKENSFHDPYYIPRLLATLNGMHKIGFSYAYMPSDIQGILMRYIEYDFLAVNVDFIAEFFNVFAKLELEWSVLSPDAQFVLTRSLRQYSHRLSDPHFALTLTALSKLIPSHDVLPSKLCDHLIKGVENRLHFVDKKTVLEIFTGLGRLQFRFADQSKVFKSQVDKKLLKLFPKMSRQDKERLFEGLQLMSAEVDMLSPQLQAILLSDIEGGLQSNDQSMHTAVHTNQDKKSSAHTISANEIIQNSSNNANVEDNAMRIKDRIDISNETHVAASPVVDDSVEEAEVSTRTKLTLPVPNSTDIAAAAAFSTAASAMF